MRRPRLRAALVLVGVFTLGALAGAALVRVAVQRFVLRLTSEAPGEAEKRLTLYLLDDAVGLDAGQRQAIGEVLARHHAELTAARRAVYPAAAQVRARGAAAARALLRPDQWARFDRFVADSDRRARRALELPELPEPPDLK